ncbi:MAG: DUF4349 domain-containing protein [Acidimicrobiales bacterium]
MTVEERRGQKRIAGLLALLAAVLLLAAACSASDDNDTATDDAGLDAPAASFAAQSTGEEVESEVAEDLAVDAVEPASDDAEFAPQTSTTGPPAPEGDDAAAGEEEARDEEGEDGGADDPLGSGGATVTPTAADLGRKLIFTANLHVEVDDVAAASAEATDIVEGLDGFVFGQNTLGGTEPSSELIFKVRPEDFNATLEALGTVGELRNQTVTTDDVTERVVDLESRIQVSELGVARLRTALEGAASLEDYAEIERLLLDRESELEVMRGQLRTLEDRIDLATITLLLTQDRVENQIGVGVSIYEEHNGGESCPGTGGSRVEAGTAVTVCFDIVNQGDETLTNITLTDTVLEIDSDTQLIEVFGSLSELAPGQSVLVAHELTAERDIQLRTRVVAVPIDEETGEQSGPTVDQQAEFGLRTFEPDTDPGFTDGFSSAVDILKGVWVGAKVTVGFLIPLLVLVPFLWLAWQGWRWLRRRRPPTQKQPVNQPMPPGPGSGPGNGPHGGGGSTPPPPQGPAGQAQSAEGKPSEEQAVEQTASA